MKAIIIGGGIGGLTTAIALEKSGYDVEVYEAAPEFKPVGAGLVLAANAIKALEHLGIKEAVLPAGQLIPALSILEKSGRPISRVDMSKIDAVAGASNFAVHRAELHKVLLRKLSNARLETGKRAKMFTETPENISVHFEDSSVATGDFLIAADGIHSVVRKQLQPGVHPRYAGYTCWRAVVPQPRARVEIPSETWGNGARFGMVPIKGERIYWFACLNAPQNDPEKNAFTPGELAKCFADFHRPVAELIESAGHSGMIHGDIIDLPPQQQFAYGKVLLLGDAAHATTPNMGQGACQAIEDAAFLFSLLKKGEPIEATFREFEKLRIPRTRKIVEGSRRIGKLAQLENRLGARLRNSLFRAIPASLQEKQMRFLYEVKF